ncbi:hypothetical protein, partial [Enterobacter hormaechei]|uniref:hypothetical protein n=1 Tax=Enterobacter hormaechei TaxID=158836 RepID=UPI00203D162A
DAAAYYGQPPLTSLYHGVASPNARQAQRRRAMASDTVPVVLPGGGCALPGLQDPLTGLRSVGPCKRMDCTPKVGHPTE